MAVRIKKKRKPDSFQLNLVETEGRGNVKIKRVNAPILGKESEFSQGRASLYTEHSSGGDHENTWNMSEQNEYTDLGLSQHERRKMKAAEAWERVRYSLVDTVISSYCLPPGVKCMCGCEATIFCCECGPQAYLCENCTAKLHSNGINVFHAPKRWKVCLTRLQ